MGILSGLESLGFKNENRQIFEDKCAEEKEETVIHNDTAEKEFREEDYLFLKSYKCPICERSFKSLMVRSGKTRSIGQDDDLRPKYKDIDPIKYDAIVCPYCGYSAVARYFDYVMPLQAKKLRSEVMPNFRGIGLSDEKYSYEEAITHYKLVLMCDVVGGVSNSRKAYTCLKMAWVIRGWLESDSNLSEEKKEELKKDERECIQNAYEGYTKAFSVETFPMSGMDEMTLSFLLAQLAYSLGKYRESLQMLANIIGNKNVSARIKDKALLLKEQIREAVK